MKTFLVLISLITAIYAAEYKAIFNLTSPDKHAMQNSLIGTINGLKQHYKEQGDNLEVVVIISGGAYKYFIQDINNSPYKNDKTMPAIQDKFKDQLHSLVASGVKFEVCGLGLKKNKINKDILYPFVKPVYSRSASLIYWQSKGYSLISVH